MQLKNRQNLRLKDYDYSSNGGYFITLLTKNKEWFFTDFSDLYNIVKIEWFKLSERFENIKLDEFVIMPNHFHGLIFINSIKDTGLARLEINPSPTPICTQPTLGDIVCAFKSKCVHEWLKHIKANNIDFNGKIWHRNYYESIIRDEKHLNNVRKYIRDNPMKWELDLARGESKENTETGSRLARGDVKPPRTPPASSKN